MDSIERARLQEDVFYARGAAEVLGHPSFAAAEAEAVNACFSSWRESQDADVRERLWSAQRGVEILRQHLQAMVDRGTVAQAQINED